MEKIILTTNHEFTLIANGIREANENITLLVIASCNILEAQEAFEDGAGKINVCDQEGTMIRTPIEGYSELTSIKLIKGAVIGQENAGTEDLPEYKDVISDVFEVHLKKKDEMQELREQVNILTECLLELSEAVYV